MRFLYLTSSRLPTEKAYGFAIAKQCEALGMLGHEITLAYPRLAPKQARAMQSWECADLHSYFGTRRTFGISCESVLEAIDPFWSEASRTWPVLKATAFSLAARRIAQTDPAQGGRSIVWTRDLLTASVLLARKQRDRTPVVFEAHMIPRRAMHAMPLILNRALTVVATTDGILQDLARLGVSPERMLVARSGVDIGMYDIAETRRECRVRLGLPLDRHIIGYIGKFSTFDREKGIPDLIVAMKHIAAVPGLAPLLLCVGGPLDKVGEYLRLAEKNGVQRESLRFEDHQPRQEVPYWLRACDVTAVPLPDDGEFFSRFTSPLKVFESMAARTPIVATSVMAIREILRDGESGVLAPPGDPIGLARALVRVLADPVLASTLTAGAANHVLQYSWTNRAELILESLRR